MELNSNTILNIINKNFDFEIVDTVLGKAIKMDAISAFNFSNVTGAGYLNNPIYPFTPKGTTKILRQAFQYNIVTGIFDRHNLLYSPFELSNNKPYLFLGDKYIIPKECLTEKQFSDELINSYNMLEKNNLETENFLFLRIESWKKGNGMECFLEYLACEYFKNLGYIVESQIPLVHAVGTPDFGGYKLKGTNRGFNILDLAMIRITGDISILDYLDIQHIIVGEAKTSTTSMEGQLEKYLDTTIFSKGFEIHPDKIKPTQAHFGLLNISDNYQIQCVDPIEKYVGQGDTVFNYEEYLEWYKNYLKLYIISNLSNKELEYFIVNKKSKGKYNQSKIIDVVKETSIEEIIKYVKGGILICQQECQVIK